MARHGNPDAGDFNPTVPDDTWELLTSADEWDTTPAADSAAKAGLN